LAGIAEAVGTPFYCYSTATLEHHLRVFTRSLEGLDARVCYSVKANGNLAVIRTLARLGAGADVVSGGELRRAMAAGVPASAIVFSGVGKTRAELDQALAAGVMQINVESEPELELLAEVAAARGAQAPVGLRVNPDVDALTHEKITTGKRENKFGIAWTRARQVYARGAAMPGVRMVGLAVHIGSQLTDLGPFAEAYGRMRELVARLRADGHAVDSLDLGGGLGIPYDGGATPPPDAYAAVVRAAVGGLECRLVFEPGRVIVGNAGVLVCRVLYVKPGETRTFVIVDAAMNDLIRPALYGAEHAIVPVVEPPAGAEMVEVDVVGPICETGDTLAAGRLMPRLAAGDLLAIRSAGAYSAVMASHYNSRPLVPEVLVKDDAFAIVGARLTVDDMLARESFPDWLEACAMAAEAGR
jgi:diaminopimelate decarboxylase